MKRNPHFERLKAGYLFPEIQKRKREFLKENPTAELISLGIGDTTEPLSSTIHAALLEGVERLKNRATYTGYGPEQGLEALRAAIAEKVYQGRVRTSEVFISDGAKCDIGRLQMLFGSDVSIAIQDPTYPVYRDGSLIQGVKNISLMPCTVENRFFPDLKFAEGCDLLYFCSPNNPTGAVATREELQELVSFAKKNRAILLYDSAYAPFIRSGTLPRSIFEIEGAREVALETSSFSKLAGFTGVRLGWTVVPEELQYDDGSSVQSDWNRLTATLFNGASNIAQQGGLGVLSPAGWEEVQSHVEFYLENAGLLRETFLDLGYDVYGGEHAPYLWVHFPGQRSWDVFQQFLEQYHLVTTPGAGFGPSGESFLRLTAFSPREPLLQAIHRLQKTAFNNKIVSLVN